MASSLREPMRLEEHRYGIPFRCGVKPETDKRHPKRRRRKIFLPSCRGELAAIGQSAHFCGEIKYLVQIGFESVPARGYDFSFSFRKRRRLMRQIATAAASKRCRN